MLTTMIVFQYVDKWAVSVPSWCVGVFVIMTSRSEYECAPRSRSEYEIFLRSIGPFSLGATMRVVADLHYGFEVWQRGPDTRELWKARILRQLLLHSAPAILGGCVTTVAMEERALERAAYLAENTAPPFSRSSGVQAHTVNNQHKLFSRQFIPPHY